MTTVEKIVEILKENLDLKFFDVSYEDVAKFITTELEKDEE